MIHYYAGAESNHYCRVVISCGVKGLASYYIIKNAKHPIILEERSSGRLPGLFMDSGAFTFARKRIDNDPDFYDSQEFHDYLDSYIAYVNENKNVLDIVANMDVIGNPKLTWRNQKILEKNGIKALPVVHNGSSMKWIEKYIDKGYEYMAFGGLVGRSQLDSSLDWLKRAFNQIMDKDGMPRIKVHGFGVSSPVIMTSFPWYSVDSTSWCQQGGNGGIYVPRRRGGKYVYDVSPFTIAVSTREGNSFQNHYYGLSKGSKKVVHEWFEYLGPKMIKDESDETLLELLHGNYKWRARVNIMYFEELCKAVPKWPYKWKPISPRSFGLLS